MNTFLIEKSPKILFKIMDNRRYGMSINGKNFLLGDDF